jgi:hypothetical protein
MFWNDWLRSRNSMNSGTETQNWSKPRVGNWLVMKTRRSGSGNGKGFRMTPFTTLKIAVFAPIPKASVRIVTIA